MHMKLKYEESSNPGKEFALLVVLIVIVGVYMIVIVLVHSGTINYHHCK